MISVKIKHCLHSKYSFLGMVNEPNCTFVVRKKDKMNFKKNKLLFMMHFQLSWLNWLITVTELTMWIFKISVFGENKYINWAFYYLRDNILTSEVISRIKEPITSVKCIVERLWRWITCSREAALVHHPRCLHF